MKADINMYMDGTPEARISQLNTADSPVQLKSTIRDYFSLDAQNSALDGGFICSRPDENTRTDELHTEAQEALGFQPGSSLLYVGCNLNQEKVTALRSILEHIVRQNIPVYMTATTESGEEIFIRGYNPIMNTEIANHNFNDELNNKSIE
ncbi:hypothetical protein HOD05_04155 [Candidatus Woesearchaeota archaeon]|jgi:hypothetical protein|nr:hypothetical protein [Candidatus Woesearchaeota archaeon]MBT4150707.1 hypothetical protein [Candidatus Woesearchaeota archaeon]MBT4247314.1 hypothetical protein [Candidatus Woesearchaeota archaeon]MBT4434388.1 hypothetical protein [Candidatus Woesearchaeota archaeon]MBT7331864.1 hypothetical protein [Candidatus Woesearchaeota archaeon]